MISDRTSSILAAALSIPPVLLVAALVSKLLPPAPAVPMVVSANDRQVDAFGSRARAPHPGKRSDIARPLAYRYDPAAK